MTVESRRWCVALAAAAVISVAGILIGNQTWMESLEHRSYHARFHLRSSRPLHPDVRLVVIARRDQEILGVPWPWPRNIHAQMLQVLAYYEAASIAWDVIFMEPRDREGDDALKKVASETPACSLGFLFHMEPMSAAEPVRTGLRIEDFAIRKEQPGDEYLFSGYSIQWPMPGLELPGKLGFLNMIEERGGVIIRAPLVMRCRVNSVGYVFPSLSLLAVSRYLGVRLKEIEVIPKRWIRLRSPNRGEYRIPIDAKGRALINFGGGVSILDASSDYYTDVLASVQQAQAGEKPVVNLESYKGKVIFIGATDPLRKDLGTTPLESNYPRVGIHATIASNVLERNFIVRVRHTTNRLLLTALTFLTAAATAWHSLRKGVFVAGALWVLFAGGVQAAFSVAGLWVNVVAPSWCMVATYLAIVTYRFFVEERERNRTRRWLIRYLSHDIVEEALRTPENLVFTGVTKKITVVLSDIRDFTPMTESLGPEAVVSMLNEYFGAMTKVIHRYGGSVNQFVGDEILAVFGAPITRPDDTRRAVLAALDMQEELHRLMSAWAAQGRRTFDIGIAINTGTAVVGNIGSLEHMDYAVMGDTINYAARLESLTKEYKTRIIISNAVYQEVKDIVVAESLGIVRVKGRQKAEEIYRLVELRTEGGGVKGDGI